MKFATLLAATMVAGIAFAGDPSIDAEENAAGAEAAVAPTETKDAAPATRPDAEAPKAVWADVDGDGDSDLTVDLATDKIVPATDPDQPRIQLWLNGKPWTPLNARQFEGVMSLVEDGKFSVRHQPVEPPMAAGAENAETRFFVHDGFFRTAEDRTAIHDGVFRPERDACRIAPPLLHLEVRRDGRVPDVFEPRLPDLPITQ